jgi:hypothetical protein
LIDSQRAKGIAHGERIYLKEGDSLLYALCAMLYTLFGSHRDEIRRPLLHLFDLSDQLGEIFFSVNEINFTCIDHEKRGLVIVEEIIIVGFRQRLEIFKINLLLIRNISRFDPVK